MSKIQHLLTLVALFVATGVWAQTDVTADYLLNSDFSEDSPVEVGICTYGRDMANNGTSDYSLLSVNGWDILSAGVTDGDYENNAVAGGTFAIGSSAWLGGNTFTAPAINSEGNAEGTALGIVAVWGATAQYAQEVMLEAGTYVLKMNYINTAGTGSFSKNLCGFIEADGTEHLFPTKSYAVGKWNTETITFELAETTTGTISLGYTAANAGSASMPHLFIQNVQLLYYDGDVPPEIDIPVVVLDRIFDDGTYYLQNLTTGNFFCAGGSWGTHAMVGDYGLDLNLAMLADGTYTIDTQISNGGEQHYLSGEWLDGNATPITIVAVAGMQGAYSLHNGQGYLAAGRDNVVSLTSSMNDTGAQWKFITKDDYFTALQERMANATQETPVDVTAYIKAPNFNRNDLRNSYWIKSNNSGNVIIGGPSGNYANYGCEFWNNTFNIYQTIQGLPDGYYSFSISGFGTNGTTKIYANEVEKPFAATESLVNQFQAALENIANETYAVSSTGPVEAIDGELTIGVKREMLEAADWTVIDNARLYYLGTDVEIIEDPQTMGSIAGYVTVDGGNVPAGTTVTITNEELETSYTATVNANGYFTVADLEPGFYEVSVSCAGYIAVSSYVIVNEGETVEQTIKLVKEPEVVVGERQKPEIANFVVSTPFVVDHNYYLYNISQNKYLSQGEAWGSQSCVVDFESDASGNKPFVYQIKKTGAGNTLPDGQYFLQSKNAKNQGWMFRVNTDSKSGSTATCFSDGTDSKASAANSTAAWVITQDENGILQITLPTEDAMYIADCALGIDPEHYSNAAQPTYALYFDIPIGEKTQWMLFDAETYNAANEIYSVAAPTLLELIGQAQERNIDVTEAQAVYDNVNATLAQINAQIAALKDALLQYATAKEPADVTDKYIVNATPTSNADGWETPQGRGIVFDANNNNAEFWNKAGYSLEQTIQNLPAGLYKLTAIAMSREGHHGYLYAGTDFVELAHVANSVVNNRTQAGAWFDEGNGVNEIMFYHPADGPLTIGIVTDDTTGDHWTVWRSFSLFYLGNDLEASYKDAIRMTVPEDWADEFAEAIYVPTYFTAVEEAIAAVDDIATVEEAIAALKNPAPAAALKALRENVAAWTAYSEWYAAFEDKFFNQVIAEGLNAMADYASDYAGAQELTDWYYDTAGTWTDAFHAGDLSEIELTTEELTGAMAWADNLYTSTANEIMSDQIFDGTDITAQYIKNPDYWSDGGTLAGWTVMSGRNAYGRNNGTPTWFNNYHRVLEMWNSDFNIYQDITLPKTGAYRVSTHGFYRCSDNQTMGAANAAWTVWQNAGGENTGANEVRAFFYADQLQKAFPNICKFTYTREQIDAIGAAYDEETAAAKPSRRLQDSDTANMYPYDFLLVEGDAETGLFIPNGVYSADYIFNNQPYADEYKMEFVFVAQKDQPVRFGIKAENAGVPANDIGWTIFDQLQLIYEGADAEILAGPLAEFIAQAQTLSTKPMESAAKKQLIEIANQGQSALQSNDGEAMLNAYTAIDKAINTANLSIEAYITLATAKDELAQNVDTLAFGVSSVMLQEARNLLEEVEYVIDNGSMTAKQIPELVENVHNMIAALQDEYVPAGELEPGTDITAELIVNPDYYSQGGTLYGWNVSEGVNDYGKINKSPKWYENVQNNRNLWRVMEAWSYDFNISQNITLPTDGVYRVATHGFYRTADSAWAIWNQANGENEDANEVRAFFYADNLEQPFPNVCVKTYTQAEIESIAAGYDDETLNSVKSGGGLVQDFPYDFKLVTDSTEAPLFIPNGVYSADYLFTHPEYADNYKVEFNFIGKRNQSTKFGIKAENSQANGIGWTIFDEIQLIYVGNSAEAYATTLANFIAQAQTYVDKPMPIFFKNALDDAIEKGNAALETLDRQTIVEAYDRLNDIMLSVKWTVIGYADLKDALAALDAANEEYGNTARVEALAQAVELSNEGHGYLDQGAVPDGGIPDFIQNINLAIEALKVPDFSKVTLPYDVTAAIKNPKFESYNGWESENNGNMSTLSIEYNIGEGYIPASTTGEANRDAFNIYQNIYGFADGTPLPDGVYELHAQGIARLFNNVNNVELGFASDNEEVRRAAYVKYYKQMPYLYANGETAPIANPYVLPENEAEKQLLTNNLGMGGWFELSKDSTTYYIPNNRETLAQRFALPRYNENGYEDSLLTATSPWYDNVIRFRVEEGGQINFGFKTDKGAGYSWAAMTNFRLYYLGNDAEFKPAYFVLGNAIASLQTLINNGAGDQIDRESAQAFVNEVQKGINEATWSYDDVQNLLDEADNYHTMLSLSYLNIYVETPGTLNEKVLEVAPDLSEVKKIAVSGSINEQDLETFRDMYNLQMVDLSETDITRFNSDYFSYHNQLTKAVLPKNLEYVSWGLFYDDSNLREIVCPTAVPPYLDSDIMGGYEYQCTLYVPSISQPFYQQANYWNWFNVVGVNMLPESFVVNHETYTLNLPDSIPAAYKPDVHIGTLGLNGSHYYGGLEVNGNTTFSMNNFSIAFDPNIDRQNNYGWYDRSEHRSVTHGTLLNNANLRADNVSVTLWNKTNEWTFFSLPFDVQVGSISKEFDDTPFVIRKYDGAKRAAGEMSNTWVDMTEDSTLVAGQGYILQSPSTSNRNYDGFSFSALQTVNKNNIFANDNVDVQLAEYLSEFPQNRSWNLVGNPYPCFFDARAIDTSAPIIVWNAYNSNYEAYSPVDDQLILKPGEAFFIQRPVDQASITFVKEGRQLNLTQRGINYFAGVRQSELTAQRSVFNLSITGEGELSDRTRFVINSDAKMSYETGTDASKFMSLKADAVQLYTVNSGVRYAINERPMESGIIELGLQVGTEGTYTIALDTEVQNEVFLIDRQNGTETRIDGTTGYEFFAEQGTIEGRFAIRLGDGELTGIHAVSTSDKTNGEYYDLRGVRTAQPRKGIYIQNGKKVVVK